MIDFDSQSIPFFFKLKAIITVCGSSQATAFPPRERKRKKEKEKKRERKREEMGVRRKKKKGISI